MINSVDTVQNQDGQTRFLQVVKTLRFDAKGDASGVQGIVWDITEQKLTELDLASERDLLHALLDNIPDSIYFKDADGRFTRVNKAHAELLGCKDATDAVGKADSDFFSSECLDDVMSGESHILRSGLSLVVRWNI